MEDNEGQETTSWVNFRIPPNLDMNRYILDGNLPRFEGKKNVCFPFELLVDILQQKEGMVK